MKTASRLPARSRSDLASANAGHGFTMIEISIVLVIIGLIIGGILAGQSMIRAAQLRAQIKQIDAINAAVNTFQAKYNCLPGDCAIASTFFGQGWQYHNCGGSYWVNGDGNGQLGVDSRVDNIQMGGYNFEDTLFWDHLIAAGLFTSASPFSCQHLTGSFYGTAGRLDTLYIVVAYYDGSKSLPVEPAGVPGHYYSLVRSGPTSQTGCYWSGAGYVGEVLTPADAFAIDSKIDDGLPMSGAVTAAQGCTHLFLNNPIGGWDGVAAPNQCVVAGGTAYANPQTNNNTQCTLNIKTIGF
jgi:prepilin-type N-terminal cleavage/methylation domain-containing protein